MNNFFAERRARMIQLKERRKGKETDVPRKQAAKAVFGKCPDCGAMVPKTELARTLYVCPSAATTTRWGPICGCPCSWTPRASGSWTRSSPPPTP